MGKMLLIGLTLLAINSFGQQWIDYKVDDNLTLRIPENFEVVDTLGQRIIKSQIDNALIMIQNIPNRDRQAINIQDKNELLENYKGFQKGFIEKQNGNLISQRFIDKDGLQLTRFSYSATMGEERQIRHCLCVFINENWYAIQFWEAEEMTDALSNERETFFSSVKFPEGQSIKNQMSNAVEGSQAYNIGYLIGSAFGYVLILGLPIALVVWIFRKVRK